MQWLRHLLTRDQQHDRKQVELERLTAKADAADFRSRRAKAESAQLASALRNTVKALRAESDKR